MHLTALSKWISQAAPRVAESPVHTGLPEHRDGDWALEEAKCNRRERTEEMVCLAGKRLLSGAVEKWVGWVARNQWEPAG
jgi:hypothetical protein